MVIAAPVGAENPSDQFSGHPVIVDEATEAVGVS
jgi:hypothetical protein